jgi:hypothetical protein
MPIARVQLPNGRIGRFEVPEGTTPEEVIQFAESQGIGAAEPTPPTPTEAPGVAEPPTPQPRYPRGTGFRPTGEAITPEMAKERAAQLPQQAWEVAKPAIEVGGMLAGGAAGAVSPLPGGTAIGGALGYAGAKNLIEGIETQLGMRVPKSAIQELAEVPADIAEGAAMEIVGKAIPGAAKAIVSPLRTTMQRRAAKEITKPLTKEGLKVARETGMELTPGQITGNRFLLMAENTARQAGTTADRIHAHDIKVAGQAINRVDKFINKLKGKEVSEITLGNQIRNATTNAVKTVQKVRRKFANIDYGKVRKAAGERPIIPTNNLRAEIEDIVSQYDVPGTEGIVRQARSLLRQLKQPNLNLDKAMKIRSVYSDAARGTGQLFKDIETGLQRRLATKLLKAVEKDFAAAPTTAKGDVAELLKTANTNYAKFSQSINAIENSVLGKMLGKEVDDAIIAGQSWNTIPPEKIVDKVLRLKPSELKVAKSLLQRSSPSAWDNLRRYSVQRALDIGREIPPSAGLNPIPLSTSKFIKSLPKDEQLQLLLKPKELKELKTINNALIRFGDRTGANTSNTAVWQEFLKTIAAIATKVGVVTEAAKRISLNTIANAMTTPEGRKAILQLSKPKVSDKIAENAIKTLAIYTQNEGE